MKTISVLLVDDEPSVLRGLRMRLAVEPELEIVGEATALGTARELTRELEPDVIVLDLRMTGEESIRAAACLHEECAESRVVLLTLHDDPPARARARAAGVDAFVSKHAGADALVAAIRDCQCAPETAGDVADAAS